MRVAFSYDFRGKEDDELVFLFKGATVSLLREVFDFLCAGGKGVAQNYRITEGHDVERLWRHCYWRLEVWLEGVNERFASLRDVVMLIQARLKTLASDEVDFYLIDDWLNLTDRRPEAIDKAWRSLEPKKVKQAVKQKKRGKKQQTEEETNESSNNNHIKERKDMPKIYVRVPGLVAGFFRGKSRDKQLDNFDAYEFADHDDLLFFLEKQLRFIPEQNQSVFCLSERAWGHILHGKHPAGGQQIINRNPNVWPDMNEICALTGKFVTDKNESADYLCIAIPKEILDNGEFRRTNGSYCLSKKMADKFISYLRRRFKRELEAFISKDIENCERCGIRRSDVERMERFMANYNMPISIDEKERESLRKVVYRLRKEKEAMPYLEEELDNFVYHVSDEDIKKTERWKKKQERLKKKVQNES